MCELLGVPSPADAWSPHAREQHLPAWFTPELIATTDARERLRSWAAAGHPTPSALDIGLTLRCHGDGSTVALIRDVLASGAIPACVVSHVLEHVVVVGIGKSFAGLCVMGVACERIVIVRDDLEDDEVVSVFKHELAHVWLLPRPATDLSREEAALVAAPWQAAAALGLLERYTQQNRRDEAQACALAANWGATGRAVDATVCARGAAAFAQREAVRGPGATLP
jgi:hypothetical protein